METFSTGDRYRSKAIAAIVAAYPQSVRFSSSRDGGVTEITWLLTADGSDVDADADAGDCRRKADRRHNNHSFSLFLYLFFLGGGFTTLSAQTCDAWQFTTVSCGSSSRRDVGSDVSPFGWGGLGSKMKKRGRSDTLIEIFTDAGNAQLRLVADPKSD